ncbi:hypothetical protein ACFRNT_11395 [Streptomyces sp. NPDC056697]|uniref:hypothetical protein n=1 Tax=Streptomyces sp. NPDC056697 TaxID=3345915 RepID=UPI0036C813BC
MTYTVGDKVLRDGYPVTIAGGPHTGYSEWYAVKGEDGKVYPAGADRLAPVSTDPRREVVARALCEQNGRDWDETDRNIYRPRADAILAVLDAMETPAEEPKPLAVGDRIRILENVHNGAKVFAGDVLGVEYVGGDVFQTPAARLGTPGLQWTFEMEDEGTGWERVTEDTEPIKVGDRVRVVYAKHAEEDHGKMGTVTSTAGTWTPRGDRLHRYDVRLDSGSEIHAADVEKVVDDTYVYDGVTRARLAVHVEGPHAESLTLSQVVNAYGPLTRV